MDRPIRRHIPHQHRQHRGFTLVELLVAIGIVAILAGLLLTGIGAAKQSVKIASTAQDIRNLDQALKTFHAEFGKYPPSKIVLYESASDWSDAINDSGHPDHVIATRSRNQLKQLFPDYAPSDSDINGNGVVGDRLELYGGECLAFFLFGVCATYVDIGGGTEVVVDANGNNPSGREATNGNPVVAWEPLGFSQNPRNPFSRGSGANRLGPYAEINPSKIVNVVKIGYDPASSTPDQAMPEFLDSYGSVPIMYFKAYANGYQPSTDLQGVPSEFSTADVYYMPGGNKSWSDNSFQLISAGQDTIFGSGGQYDDSGRYNNISERDKDNITSFSSGKLGS